MKFVLLFADPIPPAPRPPVDPTDLPDPTTTPKYIPKFHVVKSTKFFEEDESMLYFFFWYSITIIINVK